MNILKMFCEGSKKPGDWNCPNCNDLNFASRNECRKCSTIKPVIKKEGDWYCLNCNDLNFASRIECRKCHIKKEDPNIPINKFIDSKKQFLDIQRKPGDWDCPDCNKFNFGSRSVCFGCNKAKEVEVPKDKEEDDDNSCIICFEREKNTVITKCGHLGYCYECALNMSKCPICREKYKEKHVVKVFKV